MSTDCTDWALDRGHVIPIPLLHCRGPDVPKLGHPNQLGFLLCILSPPLDTVGELFGSFSIIAAVLGM